jgi:hypothetical protein
MRFVAGYIYDDNCGISMLDGMAFIYNDDCRFASTGWTHPHLHLSSRKQFARYGKILFTFPPQQVIHVLC